MILYWILSFIITVVSLVLAILPTVEELPFGDTALTLAFGYWYAFLEVIWPLEDIWTRALWFIGFLAVFTTAKFFLGDRVKAYDTS